MKKRVQLPKGLFYNTAPLGLGHLIRSMNLCKGLVQAFDIDYLLGSICPYPFQSPRFHLHQLPPLMRKDGNSPLADPYEKQDIHSIMQARSKEVERIVTEKYDFVIFEHFPFGRHSLLNEISLVLEAVTTVNPKCLIASCHSGEIKEMAPELISTINSFLTHLVDVIFLHVDPNIESAQPLIQRFSENKHKFMFTGYVTDPTFIPPDRPREKRIVVTGGSGHWSNQMYQAVMRAATLLPEYEFLFIFGPGGCPALKDEIVQMKSDKIKCYKLLPNILEVLSTSALSISLGGGGTVADLLQTGIPSIVFPHPGPKDQELRAAYLEKAQRIRCISENDFKPEVLKKIILEVISAPVVQLDVDLNGAVNTTEMLLNMIQSRSI